MSMIGIGSIVGIALLTWFAFRSLKPIVWIMLSIGIGCLGALSVSWLVFGRIHLLTLVFGATLIGVAQDYGIYFLCHRFAKDARLDSWQLLRRLFPALLLAVVTTVIGYLALALTPFPGLRQMALFSAIGLVFAWLTVVVWFPALARFNTLKEPLTAGGYAAASARWPLLRFDRRTLLAAVLFLAFVAFGLSRLGVRDDIRSLQNLPKKLIDDQIKEQAARCPRPGAVLHCARRDCRSRARARGVTQQRLDPLIEKNLVGGYQALSNWVPSSRTQAARRALVEERLFSDDGALATLMARSGEPSMVADHRDRLLASASPLKLDDFLKSPAGEPWRHLWLGAVEGQYASVVALRGLGAAGLPVLPPLAAGLDGVQWVDKVGEISSVLGRYRQYMGWVVLFSYGAVFGLLYPRYRAVVGALAPAALAASRRSRCSVAPARICNCFMSWR
jgi:predicted exporter